MKHFICANIVLIIALAGCQPTSEPSSEAPDPQASQSDPAQLPSPSPSDAEDGLQRTDPTLPQRDTTTVDARLVDVRLSNQGDPEQHTLGMPTDKFGPTDTVYAEVETTGTAEGYNLYAKWIAADGTVLSDYGMRVTEAGPKRTVISLSKPDGWSPGTHSIELAINGKTERTVSFEVQ